MLRAGRAAKEGSGMWIVDIWHKPLASWTLLDGLGICLLIGFYRIALTDVIPAIWGAIAYPKRGPRIWREAETIDRIVAILFLAGIFWAILITNKK